MIDKNLLKQKLLKEKEDLLEELKGLGEYDPETKNWEAIPDLLEGSEPDQNDLADRFEDFEAKSSNLDVLKNRLNDVLIALDKIDTDKFGKCEISGVDIEEDRLFVNPAARTSKAYMENK